MASTDRSPTRGDVILSAVVFALALTMLLLLPAIGNFEPDVTTRIPGPDEWQWWVALVAVAVQSARLAWVSSAPRHVLVAVAAIALLASLVPLAPAANVTLIAVVPAAYRASLRRAPAESWTPWILAIALTSGAGSRVNLRDDQVSPVLAVGAAVGQALFVVGLPAVIGSTIAARAAMRGAREREALSRLNELEARTEASVAAERTAIARELHDIAAHHLSGIALMSSAISQQIDTDPAAAKASLADVRTQTKTLLTELRGLVALLRQEDDADTAVESLAGLETLVGSAAARGLDVSLSVPPGAAIRDLAHGIGPLGQFAAYRTVQEALANAARHAQGARCEVRLADVGDALEILVTNGPGNPAARGEIAIGTGGFGLRGMEERASLTRSTLKYGATDDGGWRVRLLVPREPADAPPHSPADAPTPTPTPTPTPGEAP
jgi:signal transduction histidine kinase